MPTHHRTRTSAVVIAVSLAAALFVSRPVHAEEQPLAAAPAAGPSWDETSGYGAVEASRAALAAPATVANQVSSDVRWAPARVIELAPSWDATSGYGAVEASRAVASQAVAASDLGAALAAGTRAESAYLATIPLPGHPD